MQPTKRMKQLAIASMRHYYIHACLLDNDYSKLRQMQRWMEKQPATGTNEEWKAKANYEDAMDEIDAINNKMADLRDEKEVLLGKAVTFRDRMLGDDYAPDPN